MREILFRGKRIDNGEWIKGFHTIGKFAGKEYYAIERKEPSAYYDNENAIQPYDVIPETIGQYTGLTDKNGTKIFEGDIVKIHYDSAIWGNNREVVFEEGQWFFKDNAKTQKSYIGAWGNSVVEVIGNIHDNPELLKELGK